jgi:hypothetical protein
MLHEFVIKVYFFHVRLGYSLMYDVVGMKSDQLKGKS